MEYEERITEPLEICCGGKKMVKRGRKMLNAVELAEMRFSQFLEMSVLCEKYKHVNQ